MEIRTVELEELILNPDQYGDTSVMTRGLLVVQDDKAVLCIENPKITKIKGVRLD